MPLTSMNDGPDVKVGDLVAMVWVIARLFPDSDLVMVSRGGGGGQHAGSPQLSAQVRLSTKSAGLKLPSGGTLEPGTACLLLWEVAQVFPESSTVMVKRSGIGGSPESPEAITLLAAALAAELTIVPPEDVTPMTAPELPFGLGKSAPAPGAEMLPFGYEPGAYTWPSVEVPVPVVTALVPDTAEVGSPSFTLRVQGTGFDAGSVIVFNGYDEPTTFVSPTEVTTGVNMAVWSAPSLPLPVAVRSYGGVVSNAMPFTFTAAP